MERWGLGWGLGWGEGLSARAAEDNGAEVCTRKAELGARRGSKAVFFLLKKGFCSLA